MPLWRRAQVDKQAIVQMTSVQMISVQMISWSVGAHNVTLPDRTGTARVRHDTSLLPGNNAATRNV